MNNYKNLRSSGAHPALVNLASPRFARPLLFALPLLVSGCQAISDGADHLGSYMPTIGERCHHWQCFTSEGQRISDQNKAIEEASAKMPMTKGGVTPTPKAAQPAPNQVAPKSVTTTNQGSVPTGYR